MINSRFIDVQGSKIHYLERLGEGRNLPLIVLFHGFPENAYAWEALVQKLPTDFRVVAPDLPGYHLSSPLPSPEDYQVPNLIARMGAFIAAVANDKPVVLVGHDWGGAIAWPLAAFMPQLFSKLIILNAAHPSTFTQALITSSLQREKSQYIHTLVSDNAESVLRTSDFSLFKNMLGSDVFDTSYGKRLLQGWEMPNRLDAMLNYYRQMPQQVPLDNPTKEQLANIKIPNIRIDVPTLVLWGRQDDAFDECILEGLENYVPQLNVYYHDDATHWVHREQPEWVAEKVARFIFG
ncbi:alpha/beta hydrolase [Alteromonas sp. KUL49]|uniref:alpha/beta fold hydrolase n=1 Tax=Alteromonas sp. KUL49 TaxID=2480798 RepID=UPI00102EDE12|nr:alpha/beta hydrolase [Alteromonas sp. KUL49]TAP37331.1 alpha/beta hydrolase [Alteromonas sp. KUL49]GEA12955.1 AB hydrolase superfamily protein YfhM [Alteromonas sp. KUL49]